MKLPLDEEIKIREDKISVALEQRSALRTKLREVDTDLSMLNIELVFLFKQAIIEAKHK